MAIYRNVQLSFWTDNKVEDDFTPEDKYFYIYLLTNPQTNICGCYEVSWSQLTRQTGYNKDTVNRLLNRFQDVHNIIRFNEHTKEILILNWYKYNWSKSEKTLLGVENVAKHIKCKEFKNYIFSVTNQIRNGNFDMPLVCPIQASVSDTDSDTDSVSITDVYKEIIDYLNMVLGSNYKYTTKLTQDCIRARLNEKFTVDDFKTVIDKTYKAWHGTDMEQYIRPKTIFGNKFEGYLNMTVSENRTTNKPASVGYDWDNL